METRVCRKCGETKPLEEFQATHKGEGKPWRRHVCNSCESMRKQGYYNANYEDIREKQNKKARKSYRDLTPEQLAERALWQRLYREKFKVQIFEAYGNKCACCGETEPLFLTIDHVNNDGHLARKYKLHPTDTLNFYRWLVKNNYPKDFQILCMNCNFGKARNNGVCPHQEGSTTISKESTGKCPEVRRTLKVAKG